MNGFELMTRVKARFPDTEVILITGYASFEDAVDATKEGAFYYLSKPFTPDQVRARVKQALAQRQIQKALRGHTVARERDTQNPVIIGESSQIREIVSIIQQIGPTDCNVMITGDSEAARNLWRGRFMRRAGAVPDRSWPSTAVH